MSPRDDARCPIAENPQKPDPNQQPEAQKPSFFQTNLGAGLTGVIVGVILGAIPTYLFVRRQEAREQQVLGWRIDGATDLVPSASARQTVKISVTGTDVDGKDAEVYYAATFRFANLGTRPVGPNVSVEIRSPDGTTIFPVGVPDRLGNKEFKSESKPGTSQTGVIPSVRYLTFGSPIDHGQTVICTAVVGTKKGASFGSADISLKFVDNGVLTGVDTPKLDEASIGPVPGIPLEEKWLVLAAGVFGLLSLAVFVSFASRQKQESILLEVARRLAKL